jgi:WD40 repeat protein
LTEIESIGEPAVTSRNLLVLAALALLIPAAVCSAQDNRLFGYVSIRNSKISTMALQSDSKIALLGMTSGMMTVFDPLPGKFLRFEPFNGHEKELTAAVFSHDDKWFATGGIDGNVKLWETQVAYKFQTDSINLKEKEPKPKPPEAKHTLKAAHPGGVTALAFSPDGKRFASAGSDGNVKIWNSQMAQLQATIEAHKGGVHAIDFSPDGESLATAGADKTFKIWPVDKLEKPAFTSPLHQGPVMAIAFSPDGKQIASGSGEPKVSGQLQIFDVAKGKVALTFGDLKDVVTTLSFHPTLPRLASGGQDKKVRVWSFTLKKQLYEEAHAESLIKVYYSPKGNVLGTICSAEGKWWNASPKAK